MSELFAVIVKRDAEIRKLKEGIAALERIIVRQDAEICRLKAKAAA